MAEQREPVRRQVAVKIIKSGMDTREVIARLEAEQQALALMDHPGIAQVFDSGTTDVGRPFFVMELVRGIPITRYCDQNRLSTKARLRLLVAVCHAGQHAHQKGVVHRDLKPSNILVTEQDGAPVPKIIDFGIAKAIQGRLTDKTLVTMVHTFIGTPAYTSPEQLDRSGLDVDTRTDIYSLGVLLYELLTGWLPFDPEELLKAGVDTMIRTIREVDPPRPSSRIDKLSASDRATVARQRRTEPAKLTTLLHGDLDWIVMHCLEKDRARRYETANGLALDVQRHLADRPIEARPPSGIYRSRKFIRRHKIGFAASVALVFSLVAGLLVASVLLVRERNAHRRALSAERAAEESSARQARQASRASVALAERLLGDGRVNDALAQLVHAARTDPEDRIAGPRLLSTLASHNFLLPEGTPIDLPALTVLAHSSVDGRHVFIWSNDDVIRVIDTVTGSVADEYRFPENAAPIGLNLASANASFFAVQLDDQSILVYDAESHRLRAPRVRREGGAWVEFGLSPDGNWLAASGSGGDMELFDAMTGNREATLPSGPDWPSIAFSPDSGRIATTHGQVTQVWSVPDARPVGFPIHEKTQHVVTFKTFSPDGRVLAIAYNDVLYMYASDTGAKLGPPIPLTPGVANTAIAFSPDSQRLVAGRSDSVEVWDLAAARLALPPLHHGITVQQALFNRDGTVLLTIGHDGVLRVWDMVDGKLMAESAFQQDRAFPAVLSPDGTQVLAFSAAGPAYRLRIGRHAARPLVLPVDASFIMATFKPESPARLLFLERDRAHVLDVASGHETAGGFAYPAPVDSPFVSVRADGCAMVAHTVSSKLQAWLLDDRGILQSAPLDGVTSNGVTPAFSPVGDLIAITGRDSRTLEVRSLRTGRAVAQPFRPRDAIINASSLQFDSDARRLVFTSHGGTVGVWEFASQDEPLQLELPRGHYAWWRGTRFTPDGAHLAIGTWAGSVLLWNLGANQMVSEEHGHRTLAGIEQFSVDGSRFVTCSNDATTRIWDAHTGAPVTSPMPHDTVTRAAAFSREGALVGTASGDGLVRIWDAQTGLPITGPMRHAPGNFGLSFSPDGRFILATASTEAETSRHHTAGRAHRVWAAPPASENGPVPEWLLRLATACAGQRVSETGAMVPASNEFTKLDELRRELSERAPGPIVEWGRWLLADPATRSIAPGFSVTAEEADRIAAGAKIRTSEISRASLTR